MFASECLVALEVTWSVYQNIIDACCAPDTSGGRALMQAEINTLTSTRIPSYLTKLITLGRTLKRRAGDTPGLLRPPPYLQRPHAKPSTDARSTYAASPWDLRNLTHYTNRSLIHTERLKDHLTTTT